MCFAFLKVFAKPLTDISGRKSEQFEPNWISN
jgi:hypothetical protein